MVNQYQGTLIFMTDPICSWCWGTLPSIFELMTLYEERLEFKLKCAGLQVGAPEPLNQIQKENLLKLWREVEEVTGQTFSYSFPRTDKFIYHSELACRTVHLAREKLGQEPWKIFHDIQQAFYVDSQDLSNIAVLHQIIKITGIKEADFMAAITDDDLVETTLAEFAWCKKVGISALPTVFLDLGEGPRLVAGGYATADSLEQEISARLTTH